VLPRRLRGVREAAPAAVKMLRRVFLPTVAGE